MHNGKTVAGLSRPEALAAAVVVLTISVIWIRYAGIYHDSVLYSFQALSETDPIRYGTDIFLAYGSQNQFTLFSPIYGALIKAAGVPWANVVLYVAGVALWLSGAGFLSRALSMPVSLTVILLAMLPMPYGREVVAPSGESVSVFHVKEAFLTPRLYAEGLSLFGIALVLQGRRYWALLPTLSGFVLHPVMGLATLLTGITHETVKSPYRWRWIAFAGISAILVIVGGALGAPLTNRLFVTVQGAWLGTVLAASGAGTSGWGYGYYQFFFTTALTTTLLFDSRSIFKQLALATLFASAFGLMVDYVGWNILRSELILQCQPWRAIWVLTVISRIALARLLIADGQVPGLRRSAFWIFLAAICVPGWPELVSGFIGLGIVATASVIEAKGSATSIRAIIKRSAGLYSAVFFILSASFACHYLAHDYGQAGVSFLTLYAVLPLFLQSTPNIVISIGVGVVSAFQRQNRSLVAVCITVVGLLTSLSGALLILSGHAVKGPQLYDRLHPIANMLTRSGDIYWEQHLGEIWFGLGRTSYLTPQQLNVVAFSQVAAIEVLRRAEHLKVIGGPTADMHSRIPWTSYNHPWPPNGLSLLCADKKIAYVITDRQPYRAITSFSTEPGRDFLFFVYDCASLTRE